MSSNPGHIKTVMRPLNDTDSDAGVSGAASLADESSHALAHQQMKSGQIKSIMSLRSTAYNQAFGGETEQDMETFRLEAVRNRQVQIANMRRNMNARQLFFYDLKVTWRRRWKAVTNVGLWDGSIKYIESRYGSGIAGFFVLFRWIMLLNLLFAIVWTAVIVAPAIIGLWGINPATGKQVVQEQFFPVDITWTIQDFFTGGVSTQPPKFRVHGVGAN